LYRADWLNCRTRFFFCLSDKNVTPGRCDGGDRFIPNRATTQFDLGQFLTTSRNAPVDPLLSPSKQQFQSIMNKNLNGELVNSKIISYQQRAPLYTDGMLLNIAPPNEMKLFLAWA